MKKRLPILTGLTALVLVFAALYKNSADPDLFGYLSFGRLFWKAPGFPYRDVFSYLPVKTPWIYHEWLTGVLFYRLFEAWGGTGLQALRYGAAFFTLFFAWRTARIAGAGRAAASAGIILAAFVWAMGYNPVRAQVFTYLFFSLALHLLESCRTRGVWNRLWALPPVFLVWANLHGGFPAGIALVGLFGILSPPPPGRRRLFAGIMAASVLATLVNPYGFSYWEYLSHALFLERTAVTEWWSLWKTAAAGLYLPATLLVLILALLTLALAAGGFLRDRFALGLLTATFLAGTLHHRHTVFFALAAMACLPPALTRLNAAPGKRFRKAAARTLAVLGIVSSLAVGGFHARHDFTQGNPLDLKTPGVNDAAVFSIRYPVEAVTFMKANGMAGNLLTDFVWGEYLAWRLWPGSKIAVDGRYETVYPQEVTGQYFDFLYGKPGWRKFLRNYPHQIAVAGAGSVMEGLMGSAPGWARVYRDPVASVFVRESRIPAQKTPKAR